MSSSSVTRSSITRRRITPRRLEGCAGTEGSATTSSMRSTTSPTGPIEEWQTIVWSARRLEPDGPLPPARESGSSSCQPQQREDRVAVLDDVDLAAALNEPAGEVLQAPHGREGDGEVAAAGPGGEQQAANRRRTSPDDLGVASGDRRERRPRRRRRRARSGPGSASVGRPRGSSRRRTTAIERVARVSGLTTTSVGVADARRPRVRSACRRSPRRRPSARRPAVAAAAPRARRPARRAEAADRAAGGCERRRARPRSCRPRGIEVHHLLHVDLRERRSARRPTRPARRHDRQRQRDVDAETPCHARARRRPRCCRRSGRGWCGRCPCRRRDPRRS